MKERKRDRSQNSVYVKRVTERGRWEDDVRSKPRERAREREGERDREKGSSFHSNPWVGWVQGASRE